MCRSGNSILLTLFCLLCFGVAGHMPVLAAGASDYRTRIIGTNDGLPSDNVQQVFQDSEGYIWFATRNGLARYDGTAMEVFKSDMRRGDILSHNSVTCLAEDSLNRIWIGTTEGLNFFDKRSGELHKISRPEFKGNPISCVLPARSGRVLVGSDQGLYEYDPACDSTLLFTRELSGDVMPQTSVKSLLEDSRGNIWIGTWNEGIYRLDPSGRFHSYPRINERKSAHVIFEDSRHRIWVGSWDCGLFLLHNPYEPSKSSWENFSHDPDDPGTLSHNIIYSISEDPLTQTLWVGTHKGVSLLSDGQRTFSHIYSDKDGIPVREVTSIMHDRLGAMWVSTLGQGAIAMASGGSDLCLDRLDQVLALTGTNSVQCMMVANDGRIWIGLGPNSGMVCYDRRDGSVTTDKRFSFSAASNTPCTVQCITQVSDGHILLGTYGDGIFVLDSEGRFQTHFMRKNAKWLPSDIITSIFEDRYGRLWLGALWGLAVRMPDGSLCNFESLVPEGISVSCITQGADGGIWVGTKNIGVVRIEGSGTEPSAYSVKRYNPDNGGLNTDLVSEIFCDASGRIWAGSEGSGLSLYDYKADSFEPVHVKWNLPGDIIASILGDAEGNLWIGSNMGLYRLAISPDASTVSFRVYTAADGAQANIFNLRSAFRDSEGTMYFGGPHGLNIVNGDMHEDLASGLPVTITSIKVFGVPWEHLPDGVRAKVSTLAPGYTDAIRLNDAQNNFSIEFAVLDFVNHPVQHKYSYKLEGFDSDWQFPGPSRRFAYYNNLPPGDYTFRVRTSNAAGSWSSAEKVLKVTIEPPLWATWWAKCIYVLFFASLAWGIFKVSRKRVRRQNELHLRELELAQAEQLNRAKLRFFTNVTHEWLTPLSIISAVAEEIKGDTPEQKEYHRIMMTSVSRLSRLLQQVLEFRKAESGNLRLRVSEGDLAAMAAEVVESIAPLMRSKQIKCTFSADPGKLQAWFDPDKIDKILYNLLSNAAKYVLPGGSVEVRLRYDRERATAVLTVEDNGPGIPAARVPDLFKRFYEGEHRRYSTSGNGIGLSLTRDLVELHKGTIEVSSTEGRGTKFTVELPVNRDAYAESEIDTLPALADTDTAAAAGADEPALQPDGEKINLLIIEDDADLLRLMAQLLANDYNVITAASAEEAIDLFGKYDFGLIITDMMMPGMGGLEFCKWAKSRIETSHIPILLLTANTLEEAEVEAYEAGADGFMPKPFSIAVLQARISNLLRMRSNANRNFREQFATDVREYDYSTLDEEFLRKSVQCITAHISDADYSQTMFVQEMGITKSTLFRKLKSLTGLSYSSFVRNIRLKTACRIMEEKQGIRISELAYAVGFNDPKYFSLCFKKEFGMLPTEYMDRYINKTDTER